MTRAVPSMLVLLLTFGLPTTARADESTGTPAAKRLFAQGDAAARDGKPADAAAAFRKAIEADPDFVDAHQRFIETTRRIEAPGTRTPTVQRLQDLYEQWARRDPKRAAYQWGLGFLANEPDSSDVFLRKALALDPRFARAHFWLARNADIRGDATAQREHLKAAVDLNPEEPRYLLKYAQAIQKVEPARFRELALDVSRRFPGTQAAAEALYRVADASTGPERRAYFDRLRAEYPLGSFGYTATAMYDLYDEVTAPSEALSIAQEMAKLTPSSKSWARRVAVQEAMVRAQALVGDRQFVEAIDLLEKTERPSGTHAATWTLLKAAAANGAGRPEQAYATLVESAAATPDERVEAGLVSAGTAAGKTRQDIDADIWRVRDATSASAAPFHLPSSRGGAPVQLSDYRGRVVLIAFWFPG